MESTYSKVGGYYIPNLIPDPEPEGEIRKYGMMRRHFLKDHHKGVYSAMLTRGKLKEHLLLIHEQAEDQMLCQRKMNNIPGKRGGSCGAGNRVLFVIMQWTAFL
jgi:hypothetical protein